MKKKYSYLALIIFSLLILTSCKTRVFTISVTEPAPVFLDSTYTKAAVINRTEPNPENKPLEVIDKILTAEGPELDREGANSAATSVSDELKRNPRIKKVVLLDSTGLTTPGMSVFPSSISWDELDNIAKENDVDVVFVLSFYDTDSKIDYSNRMRSVNNPLGGTVNVPEHQASVRTNIKTGWRIYDIKQRQILDEIILRDRTTSVGRGINPAKAVEAVINRKENVLEISKYIGQEYAQRITPQEFIVERRIYVKGSKNLKAARRYINVGDWDGAEELWIRDAQSTKRKVAGRASFNLAIISEINGDLEKAIEWANISYLNHRNKKALGYLNILKDRLAKKQELEEQLKN